MAMDSNSTALLVIDVQQGLFKKSSPIYNAEALLENINLLVDLAHQAGVPVFYIQHSGGSSLVKGTPDWRFHPEIQPQKIDTIVHKQHGNAFEDTNLDQLLQSRDISCLVVTGLLTDGCVRASCLGALKQGYSVVLAKDGHSTYSRQAGRVIEEWNQKLSAQKCELKAVSEIEFI
jgi:nicotinamidase-related amidase